MYNVILMSNILKVISISGSFSAIRINDQQRDIFRFTISDDDVLTVNGEEYTNEWASAHSLCVFFDVDTKGRKFALSWGDFETILSDGFDPNEYIGVFKGEDIIPAIEERVDGSGRPFHFLRLYPEAPGWWKKIPELPEVQKWQFGMSSELLARKGLIPDHKYLVTIRPGCPEYIDHCVISSITQ